MNTFQTPLSAGRAGYVQVLEIQTIPYIYFKSIKISEKLYEMEKSLSN
jgi:hypothetical protein